jgi:hypothetical protein
LWPAVDHLADLVDGALDGSATQNQIVGQIDGVGGDTSGCQDGYNEKTLEQTHRIGLLLGFV